jgi:hypothetical protein
MKNQVTGLILTGVAAAVELVGEPQCGQKAPSAPISFLHLLHWMSAIFVNFWFIGINFYSHKYGMRDNQKSNILFIRTVLLFPQGRQTRTTEANIQINVEQGI